MSNVITNGNRRGNFTSSEIVALTTEGKLKGTWGKPALTYIEEKNFERKLGRSIDTDTDSKATNWGCFLEKMGAILLGDIYEFSSTETHSHPSVPNWSGSRDAIKHDEGKTVADFKAPFTLKSFCQLVQPLYDGLEGMDAINAIRDGYTDKNGLVHSAHKDGEKFYWQLVSNGCISETKYAELIVYCPYESELEAIQSAALQTSEPQNYFIYSATKEQLPFLKDGGYYSNLNIIRFEIPVEDKEKLRSLVIKASSLLIGIF